MKDFGLRNDLQEILTQAIDEMKAEAGEKFDLKKGYCFLLSFPLFLFISVSIFLRSFYRKRRLESPP